ncbi:MULTISPECIES: hypothetical protein [unclassified Okeania]|uniref:hypothetical protein n=1 Tax=unclassified Okeania TaxID=2634635 RepID=UPI0013B614FA|nr:MULTISPECIES: hypothetical protein [unclassified Okeania]NET19527.1 hypothetical protein [Okeania sp. SIO1H5]NET93175.1 hypothetical protein [Okeania sp. SIO1H2]
MPVFWSIELQKVSIFIGRGRKNQGKILSANSSMIPISPDSCTGNSCLRSIP